MSCISNLQSVFIVLICMPLQLVHCSEPSNNLSQTQRANQTMDNMKQLLQTIGEMHRPLTSAGVNDVISSRHQQSEKTRWQRQHLLKQWFASYDNYRNDLPTDRLLVDLQPVSAPLFRQRLSNAATTYHDALRLFHRDADSLSDRDVDEMITSHHLARWHQQPQPNSLHTLLRTSSSHDYQSDYPLLDWDEAMRHLQEMTEITKCRRPAPELVDVRSMQHEANRDYLPSCTVVYRCRKERGCCDDSLQCSVKTSNIIVRSFIASRSEVTSQVLIIDTPGLEPIN